MYDIVQFRSHDIKFPISRKLPFSRKPKKNQLRGVFMCFSPGTFGKEDENPVDSFCFFEDECFNHIIPSIVNHQFV